jgi:hypothetical protein
MSPNGPESLPEKILHVHIPPNIVANASITLVGVCGFAGFLVAGTVFPVHADLLRGLAIAWFAIFGGVRLAAHVRTRVPR